jgi:hypothetical protein
MSLKTRVISQADPITACLRCSAASVIWPSDTCYALDAGTGLIECKFISNPRPIYSCAECAINPVCNPICNMVILRECHHG